MSLLLTGIGELTTNDPELGRPHHAALVLNGDEVAWVGDAAAAPAADTRVDVAGRAVLPGWVDSHTHLVFAGDRSAEFEARMAGRAYHAAGIATTVAATRRASDDQLRSALRRHVAEATGQGTTCLETKTGYGLTVTDEARAARLAAREVDEVSYLGAHVVPDGVCREDYLAEVTGPMLDALAPDVRWVDVFCEVGAFDADESRRVLLAGRERGLGLRVHGNQLGPGPGVRLAVELGAASVDHCTHLSDQDVDALAGTWTGDPAIPGTVATVLPACDLSTRQPLAPARRLLDAGIGLAIATNCNPGSSYTTSMAFCVAIAVLRMGLSVEEAVRAATWGGAMALRRHAGTVDPVTGGPRAAVGVLAPGARADVHVLDAPSVTHLAYRPGVPLTWAVWARGERIC